MKMLRGWNGDSNELLFKALEQFGVMPGGFTLHKYEALTPDSFIWIFNVDDDRYCLYAEDFVSELDEVYVQIKEYGWTWNPDEKYELMPVANPQVWKNSSPVKSADIYEPPKRPKEFMKYAAQSGYDFVFLAKSIHGEGLKRVS